MKGTSVSWTASRRRQLYDANFALMLINHAEGGGGTSNTARKFMVLEANIQRWRKQKEQLINVNYTNKSLSRPKHAVPRIIAIKF
jgi:hypothetical protein